VPEVEFPKLNNTNHEITSNADSRYNCIAWAYGEHKKWFWPMKRRYWPANITYEETIEAFMQLFASIGYQSCDNPLFEPEYEKVAIYALDGIPTHAARQVDNGKWTSKLGEDVDIVHDNLECLDGPLYGKTVIIMKRKRGVL